MRMDSWTQKSLKDAENFTIHLIEPVGQGEGRLWVPGGVVDDEDPEEGGDLGGEVDHVPGHLQRGGVGHVHPGRLVRRPSHLNIVIFNFSDI